MSSTAFWQSLGTRELAGLSSAIPPQETVAMLPASDLPEIIGNVVALNLDAQTTSNAGGVQAVQWSLPG